MKVKRHKTQTTVGYIIDEVYGKTIEQQTFWSFFFLNIHLTFCVGMVRMKEKQLFPFGNYIT